MATNQTTNYHLNQWEPTDQVLRTELDLLTKFPQNSNPMV